MTRILPLLRLGAALLALSALVACDRVTNSPNPGGAEATNTLFTAFTQRSPKYLDPTSSYSNDETPYTYQIYEPLYGYHYLKYFERCRTEWLRSFGIDQRDLAQREQRQFVVADLAVQFHRPARLDDALLIEATVAERARSYLVFAQRALRHGELLATARVKVACVDTARLAPSRLPQRLTGPLFAAATSPAA